MGILENTEKYEVSIASKKNGKKSIDLNCSYGKGYSVLEIAKTFRKIFNENIKISFQKRRIGDMKEIVASNKKLNKFIKWKPKFNNLNKMVISTFTWNRYLNKIL